MGSMVLDSTPAVSGCAGGYDVDVDGECFADGNVALGSGYDSDCVVPVGTAAALVVACG